MIRPVATSRAATNVDRESLHRRVRGQLLSAQPRRRRARIVDQDLQMPVFVAYLDSCRLDAAVVSRIDVDEGCTELARRVDTTPADRGHRPAQCDRDR